MRQFLATALRAACVAALAVGLGSTASATVSERDWRAPGDKLITFDSATNREWLDLTQSLGLTYNQVAAQTRPGGQFAGWRIPRLDDLAALYTNAVGPFDPPIAGQGDIQDFTPDQFAAHVRFTDMIGVTLVYDMTNIYPGYGIRNDAIGLLRPNPAWGVDSPLAGGYFFYYETFPAGGVDGLAWFNNGYAADKNYLFEGTGVYLIRDLNAAVPEPATWAMMIAGFGLVGATLRRRGASASVTGAAR